MEGLFHPQKNIIERTIVVQIYTPWVLSEKIQQDIPTTKQKNPRKKSIRGCSKIVSF